MNSPVSPTPSAPDRSVHAEYRVIGYTLADAFRPQAGWGRQRHTAAGDRIPAGATDAQLVTAAFQNTPDGYRLGRVFERAEGQERDLYLEPLKALLRAKEPA